MSIFNFAMAAITAAIACFYAAPANAATASFNAISRDLAGGRINAAQAAEYRLYAALAPERLTGAYRPPENGTRRVRRDNLILSTLKNDFPLLPKAVQDEFAWFLARPALPLVRETAHFKIHYSSYGTAAVEADYLDSVAAVAEYVWHIEVNVLGYSPPPVDDVSDPKYDIYLINMGDNPGDLYYGLTYSNDGGYMELDNDYAEPEYQTDGVDGLKVTMAHEFFHAIQYGYAGFPVNTANAWWMEISSTWMEDVVYDDLNDYLQYLWRGAAWFDNPHLSLLRYDGWHEYGSCIFMHMLSEKYGSGVVRAIWERARSASSALAAVEAGLSANGTSFNDELADFARWNLLTGSRADTVNYYSEGNLYPEVFIDSVHQYHDAAGALLPSLPSANPYTPEKYGMNYVALDNAAQLGTGTVLFAGSGGDAWIVPVLLRDSTGTYAESLITIDGGGNGLFSIVDKGRYRSYYMAAVRGGAAGNGGYEYSFGMNVHRIGIAAGVSDSLNLNVAVLCTAFAYDISGQRLSGVDAAWTCSPDTAGSFDTLGNAVVAFVPSVPGSVLIRAVLNDTMSDSIIYVIREAARETRLGTAYPNPYLPAEMSGGIGFPVTLEYPAYNLQVYIYSQDGRLVRELRQDPAVPVPAGVYRTQDELEACGLVWDGTNNYGRPVASGIYYYRLFSRMAGNEDEFSAMKILSLVR